MKKEPSRSESRIKLEKKTVDRDIKVTPAPREPSKDKREPTPREKSSIKEEKRESTKDREDDRKKDKRREKRPSPSGDFDGDLSSVSNSSNGSSMPANTDVVIVDDHRGKFYHKLFKFLN